MPQRAAGQVRPSETFFRPEYVFRRPDWYGGASVEHDGYQAADGHVNDGRRLFSSREMMGSIIGYSSLVISRKKMIQVP